MEFVDSACDKVLAKQGTNRELLKKQMAKKVANRNANWGQ